MKRDLISIFYLIGKNYSKNSMFGLEAVEVASTDSSKRLSQKRNNPRKPRGVSVELRTEVQLPSPEQFRRI